MRRGQIRLTETVSVLFIFFILVGLSILFYAKYQQVQAKHVEEEQLQARAVETTLKALFLPELQCSKGEAEPEDNCVDLQKVRALMANEYSPGYFGLDPTHYFDLFSWARITLHQVSPQDCIQGPGVAGCSTEWVLYGKLPAPLRNTESTFFVVTLRDATAGIHQPAYGYGYLQVEVFS